MDIEMQSPFNISHFGQNEDNGNDTINTDDDNVQLIDPNDVMLNDDDDNERKVFACVNVTNGRMGAAVYDCLTNDIYILADVEETKPDFSMVKSLLTQIEPSNLIISVKSDATLLNILRYNCNENNKSSNDGSSNKTKIVFGSVTRSSDTNDGENSNVTETTETDSSIQWPLWKRIELNLVPNYLFMTDHSKTRILNLKLSSEHELLHDNEKFIHISSIINFSHINTVRSLGALLSYLDTKVFTDNDKSIHIPVNEINYFNLNQLLSIDLNTMKSLSIFSQMLHPSVFKQGLHTKEGYSLFGIFNRCVSKLGSRFMRKVFSRPLQDINVLENRLNTIEYFNAQSNYETRNSLRNYLKHVKSITPIIERMKYGYCTVNDWNNVFKTLHNAFMIRDVIAKGEISIEIYDKIVTQFTDDLSELLVMMKNIIDFEKSNKTKHFEVNLGIDEELDKKKQIFNDLSQTLNKTAERELINLNGAINECSCTYVPQIGFLISIPLTVNLQQNNCQINGLEFVFHSTDKAHYKSEEMKRMDNQFGDFHFDIYDRQMKIMINLQSLVMSKERLIHCIMECCAELDFYIAMSHVAMEFNLMRPKLTNDGKIEIYNGRHLLQELKTDSFVANDTLSGGEYSKVKILTGPNACGKSVYMKQVCLIVYLSHIGSFVPADSAKITIIDKIYARIDILESITTGLSTFTTDVNQMAIAVKNCTENSLIIADEFGKGTNPIDGLSLLAACVNHWLLNVTPHLFVSTHFHSLSSLLHRTHSYENQTFQVLMQCDDDLVYLHKLINGTCESSVAHHIASEAGIPNYVIARGLEMAKSFEESTSVRPLNTKEKKNEIIVYLNSILSFVRKNYF